MAHALQLVNQYLYIITNQSLVGISVYLVLDRSMRFPVCTVPCIPHCSIIKNRFIAWKNPCALPIHLPSPLSGSLITTYHLLPLYFFSFSKVLQSWLSLWLFWIPNIHARYSCLLVELYSPASHG